MYCDELQTYKELKKILRVRLARVTEEFISKLTDEEKHGLCACGWNYITFTNKWDDYYSTDAYKELVNDLKCWMETTSMFWDMRKQNEVKGWMKEHYGIDINDTEKLKKFYSGKYMKGTVWDVVHWIGEHDWEYGIGEVLEHQIRTLKNEINCKYWDNEYDKIAEEIGLAEANRELLARQKAKQETIV